MCWLWLCAQNQENEKISEDCVSQKENTSMGDSAEVLALREQLEKTMEGSG